GKFKSIKEALDNLPKYRLAGMMFYDEYNREAVMPHSIQQIFGINPLEQPISEIEGFRTTGMTIISSNIIDALNEYISKHATPSTRMHVITKAYVAPNYIERITNAVTNKIHEFLNDLNLEIAHAEDLNPVLKSQS